MMVHRVGELRQSERVSGAWRIVSLAMTGVAALPLERMLVRSIVRASNPSTPEVIPDATKIERPGCTAADETLVVKGHLDGLAGGLEGFGVLRTSRERLQRAAEAAKVAGAPEVASRLEAISDTLPDVSTPEQAAAAAEQVRDIVPEVWDLGRSCGRAMDPETMQQAQGLVQDINSGRISREDAVQELREQMDRADRRGDE